MGGELNEGCEDFGDVRRSYYGEVREGLNKLKILQH